MKFNLHRRWAKNNCSETWAAKNIFSVEDAEDEIVGWSIFPSLRQLRDNDNIYLIDHSDSKYAWEVSIMATTEKKTTQAVKIFVSSSYKDMIPYRQKVNEAIQRLQQVTIGMELWGSEAEAPLESSIKKVNECSLFILIVGFRYGSVLEHRGKSITQIEYETAISARIPTLVYIIDDDHPVSIQHIDFEHIVELNDFKALLKKRHVVSTFTTPSDLGAKVLVDIQREINKTANGKAIDVEDAHEDDIPRDEEAVEIFKKFILRPIRYDRQEIIMPVAISSGFSGWRLKERIISAIGLTIGDTISCDITTKTNLASSSKHNMLNESLTRFAIYAEGINADWLETNVTHINQVVELRLRLRAVMVKGLIESKENEDSLYVCAIVVGHPSKK